jgi:hypothetical protein
MKGVTSARYLFGEVYAIKSDKSAAEMIAGTSAKIPGGRVGDELSTEQALRLPGRASSATERK